MSSYSHWTIRLYHALFLKMLIFVPSHFNESLVKKRYLQSSHSWISWHLIVYEVCFKKYFYFPFPPDGVNIDTHHIPVNVTLRRIAHGADPVAAQWDFDLLNGQGGWTSDGCRILCSDENITAIQCYSLSNYAVLMVRQLLTLCINTKYSHFSLRVVTLKWRLFF